MTSRRSPSISPLSSGVRYATARQVKLFLQKGHFLQVHRADDVDDTNLSRLVRDGRESGDLGVPRHKVALVAAAVPIADFDNPLPARRAQLRADRFNVSVGVFAVLREFKTPDVDPFQL